jgi:probable rRNA maturation factor
MIEINNLTAVPVEEKFLKKIAKEILKKEKKNNLELSVALLKREKIKELNKKYLGRNYLTDVLSFSLLGKARAKPRTKNIFGEIIICPEEVLRNASKIKENFEKELARVLIHGILHLLGYDHVKKKKEAKLMEKKEEYYISKIYKTKS